jgi:hypothetical protein
MSGWIKNVAALADRLDDRIAATPHRAAANACVIALQTGFMALVFGWPLAMLVSLTMLWHEGGHALAAKLVGLEARLRLRLLGNPAVVFSASCTESQGMWVYAGGPMADTLASLGLITFAAAVSPASMPIALFAGLVGLCDLLPAEQTDGYHLLARENASVLTAAAAMGFVHVTAIVMAITREDFLLETLGLFGGLLGPVARHCETLLQP